ncbi:MAG: hypothetical protein ABJH07_27410 [Sedimentitalea sp.]|uniref:hypothetical protein n=1 Tax=Sedimentitalea sp. TaxID=2048915 RepID=UPI003264C375
MNQTVLNATQKEFVETYVLNPVNDKDVPDRPDTGSTEFGVNRAALATVEALAASFSQWKEQLSKLPPKKPNDQFRALERMGRQITSMAALVDRDRDLIPPGMLSSSNRKLQSIRQTIEDEVQRIQSETNEFDINASSVDTAVVFAKAYSKWQERLKKLETMEPRDRYLNLKWLERDLGIYQNMVDRDRANMPGGLLSTADRRLGRMKEAVSNGVKDLQSELTKEAEIQITRDWPDAIKRASALTGKALLEKLENLEHDRAMLAADMNAVGLSPDAVREFSFQDLRDAYDRSIPQFSGKIEKVPVKKQELPEIRYNDEVCRKIFETYHNNWFELKKVYKTTEFLETISKIFGEKETDGTNAMWQLWMFRKRTVDGLMRKLEKKYELKGEGTGWVAVGSTNLESDYDISVMQHGDKADDHVIVKDFNATFQSDFKTQPGMLFDTNLYASAPARHSLPEFPTDPGDKAMAAMGRSGQDVGALMKQRRFMTWQEYETFTQHILAQMKKDGASSEDIAATRNQLEEADARYQMAQHDILIKTRDMLTEKKTRGEDEEAALTMVNDALRAADQGIDAASMKKLLNAAHALEGHMFEKVLLEVNNEIYVNATEEVRMLQSEIDELRAALGEPPDPKVQEELNGKIARAKDLFADAVFFANEAYHAEGPFKHIVEATQAVESEMKKKHPNWNEMPEGEFDKIVKEERKKRRDGLSLHSCLQSYNEQLGDLIKDLKHYADEDLPGSGFYRCSKYMDRLFDAAILLDQKSKEATPTAIAFDAKVPGISTSVSSLKSETADGLLALRKGAIKINVEDQGDPAKTARLQAKQMQAFAIKEVRDMFGVSSLAQLSALFKSYGVQVNAQLRKAVAEEMKMLKSGSAAFFEPVPKRSGGT